MLLSRNADVNNQDINGMTSLDRAIGKNHIDVVTSLLKEGAIIRPTSWAMAKNKVEILALLLGMHIKFTKLLNAIDFFLTFQIY